MILDELQDFNEVIEYYRTLSEFSKTLNANSNLMRLRNLLTHNYSIAYIRSHCNNISLYISQLHEKSKNVDDGGLLDIAFDEIPSFQEIMAKGKELTLAEKKRQIRNCLAHADYNIEIGNIEREGNEFASVFTGDIYIRIENNKIKGRIPFSEFHKFAYKYSNAYTLLNGNTDVYLSITDDEQLSKGLKKYLQSMKKVKIAGRKDKEGIDLDGILDLLSSKYQLGDKEISELRAQLSNIQKYSRSRHF